MFPALPPQIAPPTYTIKQLLAYQPPVHSPPSGVSLAILAAKVSRPTHYSSSSTRSYAPVFAPDPKCSDCRVPRPDRLDGLGYI